MKHLRKRLTYANVMSSIAVFLVLGGGAAFAAGQLGKNTVGSKQLKKNAVTSAKIKKNAVTGAKVKPGSLKASNFAAGQLPAGPAGPKGETGPSFGAFGSGGCGKLDVPSNPETEEAYDSCASTGQVNLPSAGNVLLIASAEWDNDEEGGTPPNGGECHFAVDGQRASDDTFFGESTNTHTIEEGGSISKNWITGRLSGSHAFSLLCRGLNGSTYIANAEISAVLLGSASVKEEEMLPVP